MTETCPTQTKRYSRSDDPSVIPKNTHMRAYEVYCELYGEQEALVTGGCRGGFGPTELVAFLYARSYPKDQWRQRADEVFGGAKNL